MASASEIDRTDEIPPSQMSNSTPIFDETPSDVAALKTPGKRKREEEDVEVVNDRHANGGTARKGTAPIKKEYLIAPGEDEAQSRDTQSAPDDDNAEAFHHKDRQTGSQNSKPSVKRREKNKGQNKARQFGSSRDEIGLCSSRVTAPEFSPQLCDYGDKCKFEHDLRKYLSQHKRGDLKTFDGLCPVWTVRGRCNVGWKCRFVGSHSTETQHPDGRKELVLVENPELVATYAVSSSDSTEADVANVISIQDRVSLTKKKFALPKSDQYITWLDHEYDARNERSSKPKTEHSGINTNGTEDLESDKADNNALYREPPFLPSEKRRLYFGPETPVLAPLTTQGNLPFRRLCSSLGASFTYSEMAMSLPLLQGHKPEWALIKAHESETQPPTFTMKNNIVYDYNQGKDLRFGAQIAGNKPWVCVKATEVLTTLLPRGLRCVDLNVGCPIDLVYREGAGSALMDSPAKLEKILRGMNIVSADVPITCKIRMGTRDKAPTAQKLVERLVLGAEHGENSNRLSGVAAITLHGRSRQQRYTRQADWSYITSTASLISSFNEKASSLDSTIRDPDPRDQANTSSSSPGVFFLGNGDVYSPTHYASHMAHSGVDGVMIARGALIKPWLFSEIEAGQELDPSSSQRLEYIRTFCKYGLEAWGSDEIGVGQTRRFLLEWLSFACRYVPTGLLEYLPPSIQDRPPRYRGRDELETLMASDNYRDWIKLSEMFLGPAHPDFRFEPKHKSNSYDDMEGEG